MRDRRSTGLLVVTYTESRRALGTKLEVPTTGLVVGGDGSDFEVERAEESGSRLVIRRAHGAAEKDHEWEADATGRVVINGERLAHRTLISGDEIRVVDSFFRFLCGTELEQAFHETIYRMTMRDMPTGLANERYLRHALDREASQALRDGKQLAVVALQLESALPMADASHDIVRALANEINRDAPGDWLVARGGEFEVVVVAPGLSSPDLESRARDWLRTCSQPNLSHLLGVADLGDIARDASALLANARANITRLPG